MIPRVLWVKPIVYRHLLATLLPVVQPWMLNSVVGIHVLCHLCGMFLRVAFVVVCRISDVLFLCLLFD